MNSVWIVFDNNNDIIAVFCNYQDALECAEIEINRYALTEEEKEDMIIELHTTRYVPNIVCVEEWNVN